MVEAVAPGLCPEYSTLDPKNALDNVKLGFDRAEEGLGVAKVYSSDLTQFYYQMLTRFL